jgi:CheY-like chemotaxis protein
VRVLPPADASFTGVRALVVDDNATQRAVLSAYLAEWGMAVDAAADGEAALDALLVAEGEGRPFAVVLVDRVLPGMDGVALQNAIVVGPGLAPGMVLMTGVGQEPEAGVPADRARCASLSKPVRREDLRHCLRVVLGLDGPPERNSISTVDAAPVPGAQLGRLLLAEDNVINQKVAVAILTSAGYSVDTVCNGAEAVHAVAARRYDAILMDCQMPELNGYEATAAIRGTGGAPGRTPIIAMTAGARREDQERCLAGGMDSYLSKPVSKDALLAVVDRSVRTGRR